MRTLSGSSRREEAHSKNLLNARPHPDPLPRGEGIAVAPFVFCEKLSGKSSRWCFVEVANDSPSPWGEGRGEGGRWN